MSRRAATCSAVLLTALALTSCGGDDTSIGAAPTPAPAVAPAGAPAPASPTSAGNGTSSEPAPPPVVAAPGGVSEATLGPSICGVITAVQAQFAGGVSSQLGYQTQFVGKMAGVFGDDLGDQDVMSLYRDQGDALAKQECATEYQAFLGQAGVTSLNEL